MHWNDPALWWGAARVLLFVGLILAAWLGPKNPDPPDTSTDFDLY